LTAENITITDRNGNTIALEAQLTLRIEKKSKYWIAYSPHFKTFGYSKKGEDEAVDDFEESLKIFFDIHLGRGSLEKALIKFGWKKFNDAYQKPRHFNLPSLQQGQREYHHEI